MCLYWVAESGSINTLPVIGLLLLVGIFLSSLVVPTPGYRQREVSSQTFIAALKQPAVVAFFVAGMLMQLSHGIYYSFFIIYMESHNYSRGEIGVLWSVGVVAEVFLFVVMHRLLPRFGVRTIMIVCLLVATLRWLLIAHFPQQLPILLIAQACHALTFGGYHAAGIDCIRRLFEMGNQGKAQALTVPSVSGLVGLLAPGRGG